MTLPRRYCHEKTVPVDYTAPESEVADLFSDFLCSRHRLASEAKVDKQFPLEYSKMFGEQQLTEITVDLPFFPLSI